MILYTAGGYLPVVSLTVGVVAMIWRVWLKLSSQARRLERAGTLR